MPEILDNLWELLKEFAAKIWAALRRAFQRIKDEAVLGDILDALKRDDIERAIDAVRVDRPVFEDFEREIRQAVIAGGDDLTNGLAKIRNQEGRLIFLRFDARNPRAEQFLKTQSAEKIVGDILAEQRQVIRDTLTEGMERGQNPRATALDVVGRINRDTGRREGGVIGLSDQFAKYVRNAKRELENGDYAAYYSRERRDKRFDRTIAKAEREGKKLTQDQIAKITGRYADRLLELRGEMIGRTEAMSSLMFGKNEAMRQLVDSGQVRPDQVKKVWQATFDRRVRDTHAALDKQTVTLNEAFRSPSGARLMHPMDKSLGAPASEIINCRCNMKFRIDWGSNFIADGVS